MGTNYKGNKSEILALNVFIKLIRASNSLMMGVRNRISNADLTESQFGVLETLYHLGPLCQIDLGRKNLKTGGNMTMVIDNLEKRGYVERIRDENDRRYITIHLTKSGKKLVSEVFPDFVSFMVKQMSVLSSEEQEELGRLCKKLGVGIK